MSSIPRPLALASVALLCACTHGARIAVRPPAAEPGEAAAAQRRAAEDAVRDVAAMGRLRCEAPKDGHELLACWPEDILARPMVSLHLTSADDGYFVSIGVSDAPSRVLCDLQDRLVERLALRFGADDGTVVLRDPSVSCGRNPR
ncbi:conserved hypothetical protein [Anaeromyxobacter sp. Fw109-5]|nr:conserved hypothetical protein [Anaeromyxobacter sp. Fw109-5]